MTPSSHESDRRPESVDAALADYLARVDRGEGVDREALLSEHPELRDELSAVLDTGTDGADSTLSRSPSA